jgi:enoyl-CoA hydratase
MTAIPTHSGGQTVAYKFLKIEKNRHVVVVTFDRPEKLNALNVDMMNEILHAVESFREDAWTRVVIFTGAGSMFSAGVDLTDPVYMQHVEKDSTLLKLRFFRQGSRMIKALYDIEQITIAAVNGSATGGGACIAAACDFRIGADNCRIGYPEVGLGMNLSWGALPMCVHLVGPARAKKMVILAKRENAETLYRWGFLDEVVPSDQLLPTAWALAEEFAARPPIAAQMVKRSVNAMVSAMDQAAMHMDSDQFLLTIQSQDCREGITAFLEKRDAEFKGD